METKSKKIRVHELANKYCWNLLPRDLLEKILEKLCLSDCLRAVATCKDWNMIPVPAISSSLPWLIEQDWSIVTGSDRRQRLCCKLDLYEAFNPKAYPPICRTFDLQSLLTPGSFQFQVVGLPAVRDSKLGWVLAQIRIKYRRRISRLLVLYSPFVQDHHDHHPFRFLPVSELPTIRYAVFSSPPTSSDCVVYAITETNRGTPSLNIHSWRWCNDEMNWKVESSNDNIIPNCMFHSVVAMKDGTLYCLGRNAAGSLIGFKYSFNSTQLLQTISSELPDLVGRVILNVQLIERDGELLLLCCCRLGRSWWFHMIYWYDTSANCWILKQRSDHQKSSSNSGLAPLASDLGSIRIGNTVYSWRQDGFEGLMFCSFQEGKSARLVAEDIFPSCTHGRSWDRVQLLSMRPSLA